MFTVVLFLICLISCLCLCRKAPPLCLGWTFLYLLFFRMFTWSRHLPFANAIQLLLTLKVSANDVLTLLHYNHDCVCKKKKGANFRWWKRRTERRIRDVSCVTDGQFGVRGSELSLGEEKGSELVFQVACDWPALSWALPLWHHLLQLLLYWDHDRWFSLSVGLSQMAQLLTGQSTSYMLWLH